jgi:MFS family permease
MLAPLMLAPLRYPAFRNLAAGRLVTMLGNAVAPIALAFAVLDLTGSVRDLGLVVGARSLVNVVFVLLGGVLADRLPRHVVLVGSSVLGAVTQATVAALVLTDAATVPLLMALSAVNGVVTALALPAASALTPQTVPAGLIQAANVVNRLGINGGMIGGAALGGILVAAVGPGWGLAVDAATFGLAGLAYVRVRVTVAGKKSGPGIGALADLRDGWTEFASRTWVWLVVLGFMALNTAIAGGVNVLGPAVADQSIGRTAWGVVLAAQTAGMIVGGLLALRLRVRRLLLLGVLCMLAEAPLLVALGTRPTVAILVPAAFCCGLAVEQFGVAWETSMQQHIPPDRLARVYSYDMLGSFLAIPVGQVAAGPVAVAIGTGPTLLAAAGLVLLSVLGMLASRDVRRLRVAPAGAVTVPPVADVTDNTPVPVGRG